MRLRQSYILLLFTFALSANASNLDDTASPLLLNGSLGIYHLVTLIVVVVLLCVLLAVIVLQRRRCRSMQQALDEARANEAQANANEAEAKANEAQAKANEAEARANEAEARANEEAARKSEELKDVFMGNLSHSLRTPLNAIIGFSDLLMSTSNDMISQEERENLLQLINKNGLNLLHQINELISLNEVEDGKQMFKREVTDIDYEMSLYAAEIRQQLHEGVTLEVVEPVDGLRALVDKRLMRIVTMHLLENAMQHTTNGKITLTYYLKEGGMYVEVKDMGEGLPEKLKNNIFGLLADKNTYTHDENQDDPGLGLSVCKAIIDRCNGRIGVRDNTDDGRGTLFWYWTPTEVLN